MIIGIDASRANVAERTGTERYAFEVIRRLFPLLSAHQIRLYVREPLRPEWGRLPGHVEVRILTWPPAVLWTHLRLTWELLWHRPDVLFIPADTVPLIHPAQTVTTIHDIAFERYPELYRGASVQRRLGWFRPVIHAAVRLVTLGRYSASERDYHRWSVRHAVRACPRILTVSHFSKREICELLLVDPERVVVTPLGIRQPEYFSQAPTIPDDEVVNALGIRQPYFLFIGRLEAKKNIGLLLRAYAEFNRRRTNGPQLVLVGRPGHGWEEARSGTTLDGVHQVGWQDDSVTDALLRQATALVMVSQYEGFGIPAAEAMSANVPVIASRHGSLPEVLGPAAYYVDTETIDSLVNALDRLSSDQTLRQQRIHAGAQRCRQFTWNATAKQTARALVHQDLS